MADRAKSAGRAVVNGQVTDEYRVSGVPLALDKAEIRVYITLNTTSSVGDKLVFGHQLKSVVGEVMDYKVTSEDGRPVDALFSYRGVMSRIVNSPILLGTTTTLLKLIADKAVEAYEK
jgi:hypothetical protein